MHDTTLGFYDTTDLRNAARKRLPKGLLESLKNGMTIPFKFTARNTLDVLLHPRWLAGVWLRYMLTSGTPRYQNFPQETQTKITALPMGRSSNFCPDITWDDVRALRKLWPGKLIVKVMLGRAPLHGVAAAGEAGALRALQIYRDEIDRVLALLGCARIDQLTRAHVKLP